MKTLQLKELFQKLSNLNNSFTHYFFVWSQFNLDYESTIDNSEKFTSVFFSRNEFSKKHNIELDKLKNEHFKTEKTLSDGIFVLIYSAFENYLGDIYKLSKKIDNSLPELNQNSFENDSLLIDKIFNRLDIDKNSYESKYFLTLEYLRFKRNRLIHQSSKNISKTLRDFIKNNGEDLNSFWNQIFSKKLQGIDFTSNENSNLLNYNILIDTLNIFRGISKYVDTIILSKFENSDFLQFEVLPYLKESYSIKNYNLKDQKNKRKFIGFCHSNYGFKPNESDIQKMI